ncbi:unnamed protein product [Moneuplotes crassus]|uniref:Uncharacterized protein n=1 Tax=Euplotes crassus TaxID=5936 RepID=A0AAD1U9H0_EUPCR|nr:unnamed protein product [Moneuplotes crassus]
MTSTSSPISLSPEILDLKSKEELKTIILEEREYYSYLIEDLKESISILLSEYLQDKKRQNQFNKYFEKLSALKRENYSYKKDIILQKRKFFLLAEAVEKTMKNVEGCNQDLRMSDKGEIYLAKVQMERTIKDLSEEIEKLSETNFRLIHDLSRREFFEKYHETLQELNQCRIEQEALIDFCFNHKNKQKSYQQKQEYSSFQETRQRSKTSAYQTPLAHVDLSSDNYYQRSETKDSGSKITSTDVSTALQNEAKSSKIQKRNDKLSKRLKNCRSEEQLAKCENQLKTRAKSLYKRIDPNSNGTIDSPQNLESMAPSQKLKPKGATSGSKPRVSRPSERTKNTRSSAGLKVPKTMMQRKRKGILPKNNHTLQNSYRPY